MTYRENANVPAVLVVAVDRRVFGVDAETGKTLWDHDAGDHTPRIIVTDTQVFVVGSKLLALAYPSGEKLWERANYTHHDASVVLEGGRIFCGSLGEVACYSALNGTYLWTQKFAGAKSRSLALGTPFNVVQADNE